MRVKQIVATVQCQKGDRFRFVLEKHILDPKVPNIQTLCKTSKNTNFHTHTHTRATDSILKTAGSL